MTSLNLGSSFRSARLSPWCTIILIMMAWPEIATASSGFAENVQNQCRVAGRPVPNLGSPPCKTCHVGNAGQESKNNLNAKGIDYRSGRVLAAFCPDTPPPAENHPPQLSPVNTPVQGSLGVKMSLRITATDADSDRLSITAKGLPKGAKLGRASRNGNEWQATLNWTPSSKQSNRTYTVLIQAKEKGRKPALMAEQTLQLIVGDGL